MRFPNGVSLARQRLERHIAQRDHHRRFHCRQFALEPGQKQGDLFPRGRAVHNPPCLAYARRPDFYNVGDVQLAAFQARCPQKFVQISTRLAHKGLALERFLFARRFAHERQAGVLAAFSQHERLAFALVQVGEKRAHFLVQPGKLQIFSLRTPSAILLAK